MSQYLYCNENCPPGQPSEMESFACENRIAPGQNLFDFIVQKRLRYGIIPL
ncbi:hypothetical protein HMPREF0372_01122 [Flavonifractor plautii ATCC 29863]|uniref:Uncharacterized protein n=1 Tax=Flavonifractor plautii ATCC 29863 TaxID=411475 RepID=G9YNQ0_FLAPL|nr:hypothetical protein HMPREF0372_01122 [Flavonifractor plautii ATCC 29863]